MRRGGRVVIAATSGDAQTALDPLFQFDRSDHLSIATTGILQRVFVRFDHGP
jgi:hypothetical protein